MIILGSVESNQIYYQNQCHLFLLPFLNMATKKFGILYATHIVISLGKCFSRLEHEVQEGHFLISLSLLHTAWCFLDDAPQIFKCTSEQMETCP